MLSDLRRKVVVAGRVRDFMRAHPLEGVGETAAVTHFEELLARAVALEDQQRDGGTARQRATQQRREIRERLQDSLLPYLSSVGESASRDIPELMKLRRRPW